MRCLDLDGHYGARVEIDLCAPCHLVWFDAVESARLAGTGMLALLGAMAEAQQEPHEVLRPKARCPRCAGGLKAVQNRSRWGRTAQLECLRRHGAYQSFAQFLSEKGLIRALSAADRADLLGRDGALSCLNCGAGLAAEDERCRYCATVPGVFDVARLAGALDPEGATESHAVHATDARHAALHCLACGAPLPHDRHVQCGQCGATLAIGRLRHAHEAVRELEAALRAHQQTPVPHVRARRLARIQGDIRKQREWVQEMEAQTRARGVDPGEEAGFLHELRGKPLNAIALALLLGFLAWLFR